MMAEVSVVMRGAKGRGMPATLGDSGHERGGETIACTRLKPLYSPDKSF
jgi:hypothetical protein